MVDALSIAELAAELGELNATLRAGRDLRDVENLLKAGFPRQKRAGPGVDPNEAGGSYVVDHQEHIVLDNALLGRVVMLADLDLRHGDDLRAWQFGLRLGLDPDTKGGPAIWPYNGLPGQGQPGVQVANLQPAGIWGAAAAPGVIPYGLSSQGVGGYAPIWMRFWVGSIWYDRWVSYSIGETFQFQAHASRIQIGFFVHEADFPPGGIAAIALTHAHSLPPGAFVPTPFVWSSDAVIQDPDPKDPDGNIQGAPPGAEEWTIYFDETDMGFGPPEFVVRFYKDPTAPASRIDSIIPAGSVEFLNMASPWRPWSTLFQGIGVGETTPGAIAGRQWIPIWRAWTR